MGISRRDFLKLGLVSAIGYACGPSKNQDREWIEANGPLVVRERYPGRYTTVAQVGDYLTGTFHRDVKEIYFKYKDRLGKQVVSRLKNDFVPEELAPQKGDRRWVIPLKNFASHGNGPFTLYEIGIFVPEAYGPVWKPEELDFEVRVPPQFQRWDYRNQPLPKNEALPHQQENARKFVNKANLFVRYEGATIPVVEDGIIQYFAPTFLVPIWLYDQGMERNTKVVKRFSQILVHGEKIFKVSPYNFTGNVIVDEVADSPTVLRSGKAWTNQLRVPMDGVPVGGPRYGGDIEQAAYDLSILRLAVDTHEGTHVLELNGAFPNVQEFDSISFERKAVLSLQDTKLLGDGAQKRPDADIKDFISWYAFQKDQFEDKAEIAGYSAALWDLVEKRAELSPKLKRKADMVIDGLFGGKVYRAEDVASLEEEA